MNSTTKIVVTIALVLAGMIATAPNAEAATLRSAAMASAKTQKGAKYVWGAEGGYNKGYDCSGLAFWAFKQHGKTISRVAQDQYNKSHKVSAANRKPGDLIFIRDARGHVFHVGFYTGVRDGKGWMLNANTGDYRGHKVVEAPISEYTAGSPYASYGQY